MVLNSCVEAAAISPAKLIKSHRLIFFFFFHFRNLLLGANNKTSPHSLTLSHRIKHQKCTPLSQVT